MSLNNHFVMTSDGYFHVVDGVVHKVDPAIPCDHPLRVYGRIVPLEQECFRPGLNVPDTNVPSSLRSDSHWSSTSKGQSTSLPLTFVQIPPYGPLYLGVDGSDVTDSAHTDPPRIETACGACGTPLNNHDDTVRGSIQCWKCGWRQA